MKSAHEQRNKIIKAYKVLSIKNVNGVNQLASFNQPYGSNNVEVIYQPNKIIAPNLKNSKLYIFKKLSNAVKFRSQFNWPACRNVIWEVDALNATEFPYVSYGLQGDESIINFWSDYDKSHYNLAPTGTWVCDVLVLVKEIQ